LTWLSSQYWAPNLKKMVIFEFSKKKNRVIRELLRLMMEM